MTNVTQRHEMISQGYWFESNRGSHTKLLASDDAGQRLFFFALSPWQRTLEALFAGCRVPGAGCRVPEAWPGVKARGRVPRLVRPRPADVERRHVPRGGDSGRARW